MYGIYANIGGILMVNVTIYSIHGSYGYIYIYFTLKTNYSKRLGLESRTHITSGNLTCCYRKSPCYVWVNQLFIWSFSIAMLVYQRVNINFPRVFLWFSH